MGHGFYFERFEDRRPPAAVPHSDARELLFQTLAVASLALGALYLHWRWTRTLNPAALWFAIPLAIAETLAYVGSLLFFLAIWRNRDTPEQPPPATVNDILAQPAPRDRPLVIDVFFPTYSEDPELVRLSIRDGKRLRYPHPVDLRFHVLDDGQREAMKQVADEEGVGYLSRTSNIGFKAGNMRNALEKTQGDLLVICDADTRPFPELLERTLGYFRDPDVAWVQTPQWFYDVAEGESLSTRLGAVGRLIERVTGPIYLGRDPLANDPQLFFDVIQRRRNWCNASFCCGASSVHRREAVMEAALKAYGLQIERSMEEASEQLPQPLGALPEGDRRDVEALMAGEAARETELTPYKFHVSEDIYTSLVLHADRDRRWKSVYHPEVLSKMLSPQDLLAWTVQRFKYAGGTLDIGKNDNPLLMEGLSPWQKLCYGATLWSYLAPLWTVPFLFAPIVYFFTGVAPVAAYDTDFYLRAVPFLVMNRLALLIGTWGVNSTRGEQYFLAFFWVNLKALSDVLQGQPIKFKVTPKTRESRRHLELAWPHLVVIGLTLAGFVVGWLRVLRGGAHASAFVVNAFWCAMNLWALSPLVFAALDKEKAE